MRERLRAFSLFVFQATDDDLEELSVHGLPTGPAVLAVRDSLVADLVHRVMEDYAAPATRAEGHATSAVHVGSSVLQFAGGLSEIVHMAVR